MSAIPIRNIYIMLAYASREAGLLDDRTIGACDFERPLDLVARLMEAAMRRLRRRGIDRQYLTLEEQGTNPRGTISIPSTITRLLHVTGQLAWTVDELLPDTPANRVLKAALRSLMGSDEVSLEVRRRLRTHVAWLGPVRDIPAGEAVRLRVRVPRGLPEYRPAVRLARLALEHLLPDQGQSGAHWQALMGDPERMGELFEQFVRGFAAHELRGRAKVSAKVLEWGLEEGGELLPVMRTDVYLDWVDGGCTVCECKFYQETLVRHAWGSGDKVRSDHLYQLLAYLRAGERASWVVPRGLLLYARAGETVEEEWELEGYRVGVRTLDLMREWEGIRGRLSEALAGAPERGKRIA